MCIYTHTHLSIMSPRCAPMGLLAKLNHLRHEPGHPRDLVPRDEELPLDLQEVYLQAADLLGARAHGVLSPLHQLLLDVGLLPEDAELVVPRESMEVSI